MYIGPCSFNLNKFILCSEREFLSLHKSNDKIDSSNTTIIGILLDYGKYWFVDVFFFLNFVLF